jgi:hypothetical protein
MMADVRSILFSLFRTKTIFFRWIRDQRSGEDMSMKRPNNVLERPELDLRSKEEHLSRRKVLGMLSGVGAGMALAPRSFAQSVGGGPRIIDTHHHIFPPAFTARNLKRMTDDSPTFPGSFYTNWTPRYSLEQMDQNGVATAIVSGERQGQLPSLFQGQPVGTFFLPKGERLTSRKHWIGYTVKTKGRLTLDDGAVEALARKGKSLLPSGVTAVHGDFDAGHCVACADKSGREFAKGLVNYSSEAIAKIKGLKTGEIQKTLGYKDYDEVIHRDNLVIL